MWRRMEVVLPRHPDIYTGDISEHGTTVKTEHLWYLESYALTRCRERHDVSGWTKRETVRLSDQCQNRLSGNWGEYADPDWNARMWLLRSRGRQDKSQTDSEASSTGRESGRRVARRSIVVA